MIVGHKVGVFPDLTKAVEQIVKVNEIIQPVDEWVEAYDRLYPFYVDMYQHLDKDLKRLKEVMEIYQKIQPTSVICSLPLYLFKNSLGKNSLTGIAESKYVVT